MKQPKAHRVVPTLIAAAATTIPAITAVEIMAHAPSSQSTTILATTSSTTSTTSAITSTATSAASTATATATRAVATATPTRAATSTATPAATATATQQSTHKATTPSQVAKATATSTPVATSTSTPAAIATATRAAATATATAAPSATATKAVATATPTAKTFSGTAVSDQYGTVQATITVAGKKITNVTISAPGDSARSASISTQAIPLLESETLQAQSANINTVSGATVLSQAYETSLQSAISQAQNAGAL